MSDIKEEQLVEAACRQRFLETCELSGVSDPHRQTIWEIIISHYSAGNRHYHNLAHLMCMFDFVKRASKAGIALVDAAAVEWAVWFHDIVYTPCSKSNEADSAELAGKLLLAAGVPAATVQKAQRIILATADHHHLEGDADGDVVVDADLSILGAPLPRYAEYAVAVRKEYGHLSDEEYTQGRARVLKGLLDREQLFLTDIGKATCEAAARANMGHEWRLVFGGSQLSASTIEEADTECTEGDDVAASVSSIGPDSAAELAAAADAVQCECR
uniref:HD domain-containing protein n=1 Tax=Tetradesmus obliquus TaxID=3088 RepID=A0A383VZB4_TETOB|eukprot:jgi/Sobl393_1/574/SZX69746.1